MEFSLYNSWLDPKCEILPMEGSHISHVLVISCILAIEFCVYTFLVCCVVVLASCVSNHPVCTFG